MIFPERCRKDRPVSAVDASSDADGFWASYSDLMAGVLMVFVLVTAITLLNIGKHLLNPAKKIQEWSETLNSICSDEDLQKMQNVTVDCNTGALIISDEGLRFDFNETGLGKEAKAVLRKAVPKYLAIIHSKPRFLKRVQKLEISGHTDRVDRRGANPAISRARAGATLDYLLQARALAPYRKFLKEKAISAGYAATRFPPDCENDECAKARRVEIAVKLDDADIMAEFSKIMDQLFKEGK